MPNDANAGGGVLKRIADVAVDAVATRMDAWQNAITGLGTLRDKSAFHKVVATPRLSDDQLETLYNEDDLAAKIIDKLPKDATREGFRLALKATTESTSSDDLTSTAAAIVAEAQRLQVMRALREAWIWGRLYGAGAVFPGVDDGQSPDQPLDITRVRKIKFVNVLRRPQLTVERRYADIEAPKYGQPELYGVLDTNTGRAGDVLIHESRLLMFGGVMTARSRVATSDEWDNSLLQRIYQTIQQSAGSWMSATHLMQDASQGVLSISNLMQMLTAGGEELLRKRMQMMDIARSVARSILVDAEKEKFERVTTSFSGLPEMLDRNMQRVAAAAEMPVTVLFGRSPAGLNATGESDTRSWYDTVASERQEKLLPHLEQMLRLIMAVDGGPTKGKVLEGWEIKFPPLWQETKKERAEAFKTQADALVALTTAQIALPYEAALKLAHEGMFDELDVESRELALEAELERLASGEVEEPPPDVDPDDEPDDAEPDADPEPGEPQP